MPVSIGEFFSLGGTTPRLLEFVLIAQTGGCTSKGINKSLFAFIREVV
jgi:hypothetical protein